MKCRELDVRFRVYGTVRGHRVMEWTKNQKKANKETPCWLIYSPAIKGGTGQAQKTGERVGSIKK